MCVQGNLFVLFFTISQLNGYEDNPHLDVNQPPCRYSSLSHDKDMLNERWEEENAAMVASHQQIIQVCN